jgi:hypothetical protein
MLSSRIFPPRKIPSFVMQPRTVLQTPKTGHSHRREKFNSQFLHGCFSDPRNRSERRTRAVIQEVRSRDNAEEAATERRVQT